MVRGMSASSKEAIWVKPEGVGLTVACRCKTLTLSPNTNLILIVNFLKGRKTGYCRRVQGSRLGMLILNPKP